MPPQIRIEELSLPGLFRISPQRFGDERGWFSEVWNREVFAAAGLAFEWFQDNQSLSRQAGTIRGLHFQAPPHAQAKLVQVISGSLLDVVVDLRRGSPAYGRHLALELSAEKGDGLLVPEGFAHGFCTLEADTRIAYKASARYSQVAEGGIRWDDPALGIDWPVQGDAAILSPKDRALPCLAAITSPFRMTPPASRSA